MNAQWKSVIIAEVTATSATSLYVKTALSSADLISLFTRKITFLAILVLSFANPATILVARNALLDVESAM